MTAVTGRLAGQVVVVTGASTGIGRAIALACGRGGARVVVNFARSADAAAAVAAEAGQAICVQADVTTDDGVAAILEAAVREWGRIDAWVNNAGADILTGLAAELSDVGKLERLWRVDVLGTFRCCRAVAPLMQRQGSGCIVNMAWDHVLSGMAGPDAELYATAKGAVLAFSRSLARTLAPAVRVNVLAPGWIRTKWGEGLPSEVADRIARETPLRRWGTPEDVAAAALYLLDPGAAFITGQTICANGGVVSH